MSETTYLLDEFVGVRIGTPYRLFPFGVLYKGGKKREITPDMAAKFSLPHFRPPVKLGSHNDETPAGGHIVALEVRDDGLYALPEWNENGEKAMKDGAYRYHSPEVIWEGGGLEDPKTGEIISGPLIVGDALLHTPHLGEDAKLYGIELKEHTMTETVEVPKGFWDSLLDKFGSQPKEPEAPEEPKVEVFETEEYKTVSAERDEFKARLDAIEAEQKEKELFASVKAGLQNKEDFGEMFAEADEAATMLASMTEEQREWTIGKFKAFVAQIDESAIVGEIGSDAVGDEDPAAAFNAAVTAIQKEKKVSYANALEIAKAEHKELFEAYAKA